MNPEPDGKRHGYSGDPIIARSLKEWHLSLDQLWNEEGDVDGTKGASQRYESKTLHRKPINFEVFPRDWGTEVLMYVWWAGWENIEVKSLGNGFSVTMDLGPERRIISETNEPRMLGGVWYTYYKNRSLKDLEQPELRLEGSILRMLFAGVRLPKAYGGGGGGVNPLFVGGIPEDYDYEAEEGTS